MEEETILRILEEIEETLKGEEGQIKALQIIKIYKKNLKIATNKKIKKLVKKHSKYFNNNRLDDKKAIKLTERIQKEIKKIEIL